MQIEAGYALRRLQGVVGSEEVWPRRSVRSVAELRELREAIDDALVRKQLDGCGGEPKAGRQAEVVDLDREGSGSLGGSRAKPLSVEFLPGAFSSNVAARIHARSDSVR